MPCCRLDRLPACSVGEVEQQAARLHSSCAEKCQKGGRAGWAYALGTAVLEVCFSPDRPFLMYSITVS